MSETSVLQQSREMSAAELRKINKPLVEKKRRSRINNCLDTLKTLILDATKKDTVRYSKLEKADILEMTVKYLRDLSGHHQKSPTFSKYHAGFNECATEVTRFLATDESLTPDMRLSLLNHLAGRLQNANTMVNQQTSAQSSIGYNPHHHHHHQQQQHLHSQRPHPYVPSATSLSHLPGYNRNHHASSTMSNPAYQMQQTAAPAVAAYAQVPVLLPANFYQPPAAAYVDNTPKKSATVPKESPIMASTPIVRQSQTNFNSNTPDNFHSLSHNELVTPFKSASTALLSATTPFKIEELTDDEDEEDDEVSMDISMEGKSSFKLQSTSSYTELTYSHVMSSSSLDLSQSLSDKSTTPRGHHHHSAMSIDTSTEQHSLLTISSSSIIQSTSSFVNSSSSDFLASSSLSPSAHHEQEETEDENLDHNGNDDSLPNRNLSARHEATEDPKSHLEAELDVGRELCLSPKDWQQEKGTCANQVVPDNNVDEDDNMWRPW